MTLVSLIIVFAVMDKYYTSDVTILPPGGNDLGGSLNTIASIVGMGNMGNGIVSLEMYQSIIVSRRLEKQLLETKYTVDHGGEFAFSGTLLEFLEIEGENIRDTYEQAYKSLNEEILYAETDDISNILKIEVSLQNPFLAEKVANSVVEYLTDIVNNQVNKEFHEQYNYIKNRITVISDSIKLFENDYRQFLDSTTDLTIPINIIRKLQLERELTILSTILGELKKQEELFIMQNMSMLSPVKVLDVPTVPFKKSRPKRVLVLISFIFFQLFIILLINAALVFYHKFKQEVIMEQVNSGS